MILVACFVIKMADLVLPVSGIGHKIKSVNNPDLRVELVKEYVHKNFPSHSLLDYALAVEKVTTTKKDTVSVVVSLPWFVAGGKKCFLTRSSLVDLERRWLYRRLFRRSPSRLWCIYARGGR